jgi:S1-C subfamily serine protease
MEVNLKKLIVAFMSVMLVSCFTAYLGNKEVEIDPYAVVEKISETVVIVVQGSGVVVHSEPRRALILTAHHTIEEIIKEVEYPKCLESINTSILIQTPMPNSLLEIPIVFKTTDLVENKMRDLALIEVETDSQLEVAVVSKKDLRLGEDIYTVSNPQNIYRSLKKGIVSSTYRVINGTPSTEISGGVIYGSSGGGVFTMDGKLAGILFSLKLLESDYCYEIYDDDNKLIEEECIQIPLPYIGFAHRPDVIRKFLLNSKFKEDFKYLEVKKYE